MKRKVGEEGLEGKMEKGIESGRAAKKASDKGSAWRGEKGPAERPPMLIGKN